MSISSGIFISKVKNILADNGGQRRIGHKLSGNGIDAGHIALADAGERRIFTRTERRMFRDYHIMLLIDVSGSMEGTRCEQAAIATHALHHALEASGGRMYAAMFNAKYERIEPAILKDINKLYERMHAMTKAKGAGCTHTAYAIDQARKTLIAATNQPSRIILVLTDGGACCGSDCGPSGNNHAGGDHIPRYHHQINANKRSVAESREVASVLAIGIEDEDRVLEMYGKDGESINHATELYPAALALLSSAVKRG